MQRLHKPQTEGTRSPTLLIQKSISFSLTRWRRGYGMSVYPPLLHKSPLMSFVPAQSIILQPKKLVGFLPQLCMCCNSTDSPYFISVPCCAQWV